jgi:autoinducer 2 (AI-2) kinase
MSYLLALDAGTGSSGGDFRFNGRQIAVGQAEWKHLSVENVPGSMEFDLTTNWQLACQCIRQALAPRISLGGYSVRRLLFDARRHRAV